MKKMIAWLLVLTMALSLWGCGSDGAGSLGGGNPMRNEFAYYENQEDPEAARQRLSLLLEPWEHLDTSVTLQSQVILENSQARVTLESLSYGQQVMTATFRVENLSDQSFDFYPALVVNGLRSTFGAEDTTVEPGAVEQIELPCSAAYLIGSGTRRVDRLQVFLSFRRDSEKQSFVVDAALEGANPENVDPNSYITMMRDPEQAAQLGRKVLFLKEDLDFTAGDFAVDSAAVYFDYNDKLCIDIHVVNTAEETRRLLLKGPFVNGVTDDNYHNNDYWGLVYPGTGCIVGCYAGSTERLEALGIERIGAMDLIISDKSAKNPVLIADGQVLHLEAEEGNPGVPTGENEIYRDDTLCVRASGLSIVEREGIYWVFLPLVVQKLRDVKATISAGIIQIDGANPDSTGNGVGPEMDYPGFMCLRVEKFFSREEAEAFVESCQKAELRMGLRYDYGEAQTVEVTVPLS